MGKDSLTLLKGTLDTLVLKALSWGPLHGLPITVKDCFETAGLRTTAGTKELFSYSHPIDNLNVGLVSYDRANRVLGFRVPVPYVWGRATHAARRRGSPSQDRRARRSSRSASDRTCDRST